METTRIQAALFGDSGPAGETIIGVYGPERLQALRRLTELYPVQVTSRNFDECLPDLQELEVIFSTWGMLALSSEQLDRLPNLRAVFYSAGSVKYFARPFLERGIAVVSAWAANAVPVAEFTLAQILLANKGYFRNLREYEGPADFLSAFRGPGNFGTTISLLGVGQVGRTLIELLRPFRLHVLVFDPFLSHQSAAELGVQKIETLEEAFARGDVVSNHLADVPATVGLLTRTLFDMLKPGATFINTGRGRTVDHDGLLAVLRMRRDLTALLDVTDPEPLPRESSLRYLPNVHITSHIAGSIGGEVRRMADTVLDEFAAWSAGESLRYAVTLQMLETMA